MTLIAKLGYFTVADGFGPEPSVTHTEVTPTIGGWKPADSNMPIPTFINGRIDTISYDGWQIWTYSFDKSDEEIKQFLLSVKDQYTYTGPENSNQEISYGQTGA